MSAKNHAVDGQKLDIKWLRHKFNFLASPTNDAMEEQRAAKNRTVSTLGIGVSALVIRSLYRLGTPNGQHLKIIRV